MTSKEENNLVLERPTETSKRNNDKSQTKIIATSYSGQA